MPNGGAEFAKISTLQENIISAKLDKNTPEEAEIAYIHIAIGEEDQNVNTDVNCKISVEIEGDGELLGVGSGNPKSEESFLGNSTYTWNGRALAIVKKGKGRSLIVFTTEDGGSARIEI